MSGASSAPARAPAGPAGPAGPDVDTEALRRLATGVLRANDVGSYTVPSRATYPHQWNWDSALCALGWAEIDPGRAWLELESLVGARDGHALVPHIAFDTRVPRLLDRRPPGPLRRVVFPRARGYLPGATWWGRRVGADGRRISAITQPPLAATCLRLLHERAPDEGRARALLGPLHAWHRFLLTARDPDGAGEPVLIHPWESGRDNAREWDGPLWRVEPRVAVIRRRDTLTVDAAERPSDEHYRRFLTLVEGGTAMGWPQGRLAEDGPFRVRDPGFTAILARACADLAHVAKALGDWELEGASRAAAGRASAALRRRTGADGLIRPVDLIAGRELDATSAGLALAVLCPELDPASVAAARDLVIDGPLASRYGVRSLAAKDAECSQRNYWRGPVWANVTWLCAHGLAAHGEHEAANVLRARMVRSIAGGGMREYFEPESGRGLGASDFGWSAALTLRELSRRPP